MDWKKDAPLRAGMRTNPVMHSEVIDLDALGIAVPTEAELLTIFKTPSYRLQTWNRRVGEDGKTVLLNDPHWLAVRRGTPMHFDPKYPRYSHQLKVRVDSGIFVRGIDGVEMPLVRGTFYILDAHSPHQVFHKDAEGAWNVTASIDHHILLNPQKTLARLIEYAKKTHILEGAPA